MATGNTFDLLILPVFECTAGIFATFAIITAIQSLIGYLFEPKRLTGPEPAERRAIRPGTYRPAAPRVIRSGGGVA